MSRGNHFLWGTFIHWMVALCLVPPAAARADINAWYESVYPSAPGGDILDVQQGGPGAPLIITTDGKQDEYEFTIRFFADVDPTEAIYGYAVDVIAPDDASVSVTDLAYLGNFAFDNPAVLGSGPGVIVDDAGQFTFSPEDGLLELFEFVLVITGPTSEDNELFSGIGAQVWATGLGSPMVIYADSEPLYGGEAGLISSTPSIIIRHGQASEATDCNDNGIPDDEEITADPSQDCNNNGILDECDLADATSLDCNNNGIPDECDIANGTSLDCNGNGIPDECDIANGPSLDCNGNGVPDKCDITDATSLDCNSNNVPDKCDIADATSLDCNGNNVPDECDIANGTSLDCNGNGVPDECDIADATSLDCNDNGVPDECDLADATSLDCNGNGVPDECDIANGTSLDCNENGIPDECDIPDGNSPDCNGNGVPDECDITNGTSLDADGNGIPDECEAVPGDQPDLDDSDGPDGSDGQDDSDHKWVDRNVVRSLLAFLLVVPADGRETPAVLPVKVFGVFGVHLTVALTFLEWLNLPVRAFLFEVMYAFLDAILP